MKAAIFKSPKTIEVVDREIPQIDSGSILVKVKSCAVCGSDQRIYTEGNNRITSARVLGHEISGEVVDIGSKVKKFKVGQRVSIGADIPCGECNHCKHDRANCCRTNLAIGYQYDGGFAEYIMLNTKVVEMGPVHFFDEGTDFDSASLAEPLACCINGYEIGLIKKDSVIAVFGLGPIGIMLGLLSRIYQSKKLILVEPSEFRRNFAKQILPESNVINPSIDDPVNSILDITNGKGCDLIFTACPVVDTHYQAIDCVGVRGVVNLFGGLPKTAPKIEILSNSIHYKEAYITGSHGSTPRQHKEALNLIINKIINVKQLITSKVSLDEINSVFSKDHVSKSVKTVVHP